MIFLALIAGIAAGSGGYYLYKRYGQQKINTVTETEFKKILKKKKLLNTYNQGRILCAVSGEPITFDNLGYIDIREDDAVVIVSKESMSLASRTTPEELEPVIA